MENKLFKVVTDDLHLVFTPINAAIKNIYLRNYKDEKNKDINVLFHPNKPVFSTFFQSKSFVGETIDTLYHYKVYDIQEEKFNLIESDKKIDDKLENHYLEIAKRGYNQFKKKYYMEGRYSKGPFYSIVFRTVLYLKDISQEVEFFKVFYIKKDESLLDIYFYFKNLSKNDVYFEGNDLVKGLNSSFYTHWGKSLGPKYEEKSQYDNINLSYLNVGLASNKSEEVIIQDSQVGIRNLQWVSMNSRYLSVFLIPEWNLTNSGRKLWKNTNYFGNIYPGKVEVRKYFFNLWISHYPLEDNQEQLEIGHSKFYLEKNSYKEFYNTVFLGPKTRFFLNKDSYESFDFSIIKDRTWIPLIKPIEWILEFLIFFCYGFVKNYGLCIVFLSIFLKIIFYPLTKRSIVSVQKIKALSPKLKEIDRIYKNNPQKKQKAIFQLYRKEKVNPFSGCLPILIQIPIFYSLWTILPSLLELKNSNFLWINDLSSPDTILKINFLFIQNLNILPILMLITSIIQIWITPQNTNFGDKNQSMVVFQYVMPFVLLGILWNVSSGLTLYWVVQNILQIFQQIYINMKDKITT